MKKLLIVAICAFGVISAQAQGKLNFLNVNGGVLNVDGTPVDAGQGIMGQLWAGPSEDVSSLAPVGTPAEPFAAGTWNVSANIVFPNTPAGDTVFVQLRAWDSATGSDFASATISGVSDIVPVVLNDPAAPGPFIGTEGFQMGIIPEPSMVALAILGAAALFIRRRK